MNNDISEGSKRFLARCIHDGGVVSDGPIASGWGVLPFKGSKAHRWSVVREDGSATLLRSACGMEDYAVPSVPLLGAGSYPFCQRCEAKLMRRHR